MSGISYNERKKRESIEFARWKEAVLHLHYNPLTSELDTFEPWLRTNVAFHGEWLKDEKRWKQWELSEEQEREVIWQRWKSSELPLTERLLQKLNAVWKKGYEDFWDREYVRDDIIDVLSRWKREKKESLCSDSSGTPELDYSTDILYSGIPRSDIRALKEAL